ncbi:helix-turn-helix domain-containing protein [bacterium]|nr:helix-turn-helix domain-containing protein [bacterium]
MTTKISTMKFLEKVSGKSLSLGSLLEAIRLGEEMSQVEFAKKLKISRSHLCDIEKGRKLVSPSRAVIFANALGFSPIQFVRLSLQDELSKSGLKFKIQVDVA